MVAMKNSDVSWIDKTFQFNTYYRLKHEDVKVLREKRTEHIDSRDLMLFYNMSKRLSK